MVENSGEADELAKLQEQMGFNVPVGAGRGNEKARGPSSAGFEDIEPGYTRLHPCISAIAR
jgi:hypothetical protein